MPYGSHPKGCWCHPINRVPQQRCHAAWDRSPPPSYAVPCSTETPGASRLEGTSPNLCTVYGMMVYGIIVYSIWYMVYGIWYMVYGIWYMVYGMHSELKWIKDVYIYIYMIIIMHKWMDKRWLAIIRCIWARVKNWCTQKCDDLRQEWAKICDYLGLNFRPIPSHVGIFMYCVQMDIATTRKNSAVNQQTCGS